MNNLSLRTNSLLNPFAATAFALGAIAICAAQTKPAASAPNPAPDVLVLSNGDALHGKLVNEAAGKVTFHSDPLGDISLAWDKIKELHVAERFGVLSSTANSGARTGTAQIPMGTLDANSEVVTVHPASGPANLPVPVKDAEYILDEVTLDKEVNHQPNFFTGWNGAATAGATLVSATENQYTFSGAVNLARVVPTVSWLNTRNRTSAVFSGSFGKITEPGYTVAGAPPTVVAPETTKTAIYHAGGERDQYFSPRVYALGQAAFDHNFSQNLALQQIYGGGIGWTAIKQPKQVLDLKGTMQYEEQSFLGTAATAANPAPPAPSPSTSLVGSTFSATYGLHLKLVTFTQAFSFIPSYNQPRDYSASETNAFAFPAFKGLGFSVGTLDSYLNNAPVGEPPTKPNSFQFTMGFTYGIKSKY
jgi:Protein of unknown function, DUF481